MKWLGATVVAVLLIAILVGSESAERGAAVNGGGPAVLLELYTSQGCSSCPPADRLLSALEGDDSFRGVVVPLAFHVDYWDRLGWRDPFSSREWSERQRNYSRAWRADRVYTPQLIIDGVTDVVGSDERGIRRAIAAELARPRPVHLAMSVLADDGGIEVKATVGISKALSDEPLDLMIAVFENGFLTEVAVGENGGRKLKNDYVVRALTRVVRVDPKIGSTDHRVTIPLDPAWRGDRLGVAVFLQETKSLRILGAVAGMVSGGGP